MILIGAGVALILKKAVCRDWVRGGLAGNHIKALIEVVNRNIKEDVEALVDYCSVIFAVGAVGSPNRLRVGDLGNILPCKLLNCTVANISDGLAALINVDPLDRAVEDSSEDVRNDLLIIHGCDFRSGNRLEV